MRRGFRSIAIILIVCSSIIQAGCAKSNTPVVVPIQNSTPAAVSIQSGNSTVNTSVPDEKPEIDVQSPMTLSNSMCSFNGQSAFLRLKMVKGRYYEDWNPGAYMGTLWEGSFKIELADEYGKTIAETDISKMFSGPLTFKSSFNLEFDDYNNDGDPDFTIGQYASGNGRLYKIFTLRKDGNVEELPVKDHPDLFVSNSAGYYSAKLNKIDGTTFEIGYYDNSIPATFQDSYQWDGKQFALFKSQKMTGEESQDIQIPSLKDTNITNTNIKFLSDDSFTVGDKAGVPKIYADGAENGRYGYIVSKEIKCNDYFSKLILELGKSDSPNGFIEADVRVKTENGQFTKVCRSS